MNRAIDVPHITDPNPGVRMFEPADIVASLEKAYAA
jgi:hypothetical protein